MQLFRRGPRKALAAGVGAALALALTAGCTGDEQAAEEPSPSPLPSRSVGAEQTLEAKPVPTKVTVARVVGGKLPKQQRRRLDRQVTRVVEGYFDDAFLAGRYPRRNFSDAFATFSAGAERKARGERDLLSNAAVGGETEAVVPRVKAAWVDVLVPGRVVAGMTARFRLVFLRQASKGNDQRVTVRGRLLLERGRKPGSWRIFGYDVSRSAVPAAKGAS